MSFMKMHSWEDDDQEEGSMIGSMLGPKMGTWSVNSKMDPRWNKSGRALGLVTSPPGEIQKWIEECKKKYGKIPKDCEYSFMKD